MTDNIYQPNKRIPNENILQKFRDEFYIDQYGDLRNKINRGPGHGKDQLAGKINGKYIKVHIFDYEWTIHCIVDYLHNGDWYPDIIDHIDRNTLHNNIHNLKRSNKNKNSKNLSINIRNTSGVTGLSVYKNKNEIECSVSLNRTKFHYLNKNKKIFKNDIYYWSSFKSAWEVAQLFNWLIRKQNGFSVDHLPEIKVDLNRKSKNCIDWNSNNIDDIPGIRDINNQRFCIKVNTKKKSIIQYILYNKDKNLKNKFYWKNKKQAFEVSKLYCYLLRRKYNLPV